MDRSRRPRREGAARGTAAGRLVHTDDYLFPGPPPRAADQEDTLARDPEPYALYRAGPGNRRRLVFGFVVAKADSNGVPPESQVGDRVSVTIVDDPGGYDEIYIEYQDLPEDDGHEHLSRESTSGERVKVTISMPKLVKG